MNHNREQKKLIFDKNISIVMPKILKKLKRGILIAAGFFFVGIGILGIFVPLLPTTVFFLLAAYCFARSSEKFYNWLIYNKWFGSYIRNYKEKKGTSWQVKAFTISFLWITILVSGIYFIQNMYIRIALLLIAVGVTIHLLSLKTLKS